jgi:carboxymethylenebutenolidase
VRAYFRNVLSCPEDWEAHFRMERKKASDYPQELLDLFDRYVHGDIDRRGFLEGARKFATGGVTAMALWESLRPNYAWAQQVPKDDSRIKTEYATVPSPQGNGEIRGYLVRPAKAGGKLPGVLVVHENRGLNPYIEDVARRLGTANFIAFAPDGLTSVGGYPGADEKGGQLFGQVDRQKMLEDFVAAARWLKARSDCTGKIGVVGFCFGGGIANTLAVRLGADLSAAAPFYGGQPPAADVAKIKAPLLLHYAGLDTRVNGGWPAYEEALKANHVTYTAYVYEGANHGFHNDTTPRYDEAAAKLAWKRTLDFFNQNLR